MALARVWMFKTAENQLALHGTSPPRRRWVCVALPFLLGPGGAPSTDTFVCWNAAYGTRTLCSTISQVLSLIHHQNRIPLCVPVLVAAVTRTAAARTLTLSFNVSKEWVPARMATVNSQLNWSSPPPSICFAVILAMLLLRLRHLISPFLVHLELDSGFAFKFRASEELKQAMHDGPLPNGINTQQGVFLLPPSLAWAADKAKMTHCSARGPTKV